MSESVRPAGDIVYVLMTETLRNDKRILFVPQLEVSKSKLTLADRMNVSYHGHIHSLVTDESKHCIIDYKEYRHGEAACIGYRYVGEYDKYTVRYNIIECIMV